MNNEDIKKLVSANLDFNQLEVMKMVKSGTNLADLQQIKKVAGWTTLLLHKGLVTKTKEGFVLTEEGNKIVGAVVDSLPLFTKKVTLSEALKDRYDYSALALRLREKLYELTGEKQFFLEVRGVKYPYIPSAKDLELKITKFKQVYKMDDMQKIEKCLLHHCSVRNQKMLYYIMREKENAKSDMASDYENIEDLELDGTGKIDMV